jgi:hypothetical protein
MTEEKLVAAQVTREVKIAKICASALLHYRGARNAWSKKIGPKAADALDLLCKELAPRVEEAGLTLEAREQALNQERQDDEPMRAARDARSAVLNQTILRVKGLVSATFGDEALVTYGLSSAVPATPDGRHAYARNAAGLLRKDARVTQDALGRDTSTVDLAGLLEQAAGPLDDARADETREALELTAALSKRDEAAQTLRDLTTFARGLLDLSLRLADQDRAADKLTTLLRPRTRGEKDADAPLPALEPIA